MTKTDSHAAAAVLVPLGLQQLLDSAGGAKNSSEVHYGKGESIFTQGDPCHVVMYIQSGAVKLSVLAKTGKEAVVAMLGPGDFFGEGCLLGQPHRMGSARALLPSTVVHIGKGEMIRLLRQKRAMSDRFISHLLARNIRSEEDLVDQLFNSSEKRLARALLLLARGQQHPVGVIPKISQETLAEMVGTTRSRVNYFLRKFQKLGLIEYHGDFKVHSSRLSVILQADAPGS